MTSGRSRSTHSRSWASRARIPLTFQVATLSNAMALYVRKTRSRRSSRSTAARVQGGEACALFRQAAYEVEHGAIEELRLLPVDRVPGLGYQRQPAVRNLSRNHPRDRRRRKQVRSAGNQQGRQLELLQPRLRDLLLERLSKFGPAQRLVLEFHPRLHAFGAGRSV